VKTDVMFRPQLSSRHTLMHAAFLCSGLLIVAMGWESFHGWLGMLQSSEQSSSLWIIPLISAFLIYERRQSIFASAGFAPHGLVFVAFGLGLYLASFGKPLALARFDAIALAILGLFTSLAGAFLICYGTDAGRKATFPLGFLLFAVPIPQAILESLVRWLQWGSAAVVNFLFNLLSVPHLRDGLRFYLSSLNIEIASECSGIRSSFALLVLTVLLSYITLHSAWRRLVLILTVIPLVLIKNGIRIVTLSLLAIYVDRSFITGSLHRRGGFVFFGLALAAEGVLCWLLQRSEVGTQAPSGH